MSRAFAVRPTGKALWKLPLDRTELARALSAMLQAVNRSGSRLELTLIDDAAMEALNREHMGLPGPTNVLSFPGVANGPGGDSLSMQDPFLGWMALCSDAMHRECLLYGQDPVEHALRLLSHGLAHLLGHEHGPAMDDLAERMHEAALALFLTQSADDDSH